MKEYQTPVIKIKLVPGKDILTLSSAEKGRGMTTSFLDGFR